MTTNARLKSMGIVCLAVASIVLALGSVVAPRSAHAGPASGWEPLGGQAISPGTEDIVGDAVQYQGASYVAMATTPQPTMVFGLRDVTVWRYDRALGGWTRVGAWLNTDVRHDAMAPTLAVSAGRLYVAFNEFIDGSFRVVVRRLDIAGAGVQWHTVGRPLGQRVSGLEPPALAAVGAGVWVAWTEFQQPSNASPRTVRLARLQPDDTWQEAPPLAGRRDSFEPRMIGTPTGAYLALLEREPEEHARLTLLEVTDHTIRTIGEEAPRWGVAQYAMASLVMPNGQHRLFLAYSQGNTPGVQVLRTSAFGTLLRVCSLLDHFDAYSSITMAVVDGRPYLALRVGRQVVVGRIAWDELPARIQRVQGHNAEVPLLGGLRLLDQGDGRAVLFVNARHGREHEQVSALLSGPFTG